MNPPHPLRDAAPSRASPQCAVQRCRTPRQPPSPRHPPPVLQHDPRPHSHPPTPHPPDPRERPAPCREPPACAHGKKSTRRTSRVPPPSTRTRARLPARAAGRAAAAAVGRVGRRSPAAPPRPAAARRACDEPAEHADVGGAVGAERHRRVVVVVAEALAGEALVDRRPVPEVDRGEVPGVAAVARLRASCRCRRGRSPARASAPPRARARRAPDGVAAAARVEVDALEARRGRPLRSASRSGPL